MTTLRNVQALRAIAALLVVCVHMGNPQGFEVRYLHADTPLLSGFTNIGYTGVDLFFIISGFIMTVTTLGRSKVPTSIDFFVRRIIRIYPPLWIITGLLFAVYCVRPDLINSHSAAPPDILASFLAFPQRGSPLLLVAWSLAYEMYFYVVFTAALSFGRRSFAFVLVLWAAITIGCNLAFGGSENPWLHTISNPICFEFLLGVTVAWLLIAGSVRQPFAWLLAGLAGYGLEAAFTGFGSGWSRVLAAVPMAAILYGAVGVEQAARVVLPQFLDRLGDASYATYLWHVPVLATFGIAVEKLHPHGPFADAVVVVLGIVIVECVALTVYRFIERPITDHLRAGLHGHRPQPVRVEAS